VAASRYDDDDDDKDDDEMTNGDLEHGVGA
jgi:hypothetical protein